MQDPPLPKPPSELPSQDVVAEIIDDLLGIVKGAMPPELFEVDLRVLRAQALAALLKREVQ
jgi:hypothetical protein